VPKTIDNDLGATDYTFGFDTAVSIATEAIDRLRTTAASHHRAMVVEVMGRHAGWIALHAGVAGGACAVLVPEQPFDVDEVVGWVRSRMARDEPAVVVVAEGAAPVDGALVTRDAPLDAFGHPRLSGIGEWLAARIEDRGRVETRATVLGHVQRGGSPTAYDRWLATRFGLHAIDALHDGAFGTMVALRGTDVVRVPLADATAELKTVPGALYAEVRALFG
jgi:6-phosphofructokinase 1